MFRAAQDRDHEHQTRRVRQEDGRAGDTHIKERVPRMSSTGVGEDKGPLEKIFKHRVEVYEDTRLPYESTIDFDQLITSESAKYRLRKLICTRVLQPRSMPSFIQSTTKVSLLITTKYY